MDAASNPGYRIAYNINPLLRAANKLDENENPTGGEVSLHVTKNGDEEFPALIINWQDGPRGTDATNPDGSPVLADPNGAFVEDVLWAALQRLEFFNNSKYRDRANSMAITHIEQALQALKDRQLERSYRNVEGKHEV
jgi:hypothetical protein